MQIEEYLTRELKNYYLKDFEILKEFSENEFWKLDEGTLDTLLTINEKECLHTLYSKRHTSFNEFALERLSYLKIAFQKEKESELHDILQKIRSMLESESSEVDVLRSQPENNPNFQAGSTCRLGCINNPDYFRIHSYTISIISDNQSDHEQFFEFLTDKISKMKCSS